MLSRTEELHKEIWRRVIESMEALGSKNDCYEFEGLEDLKLDAVEGMWSDGVISDETYDALAEHGFCVMCAAYESCDDCALVKAGYGLCGADGALYKRLVEAEDSAEMMRLAKKIQAVDAASGVNPKECL